MNKEAGAYTVDPPFIHHYPDGNATIARMLVKNLVPDVGPGENAEEIHEKLQGSYIPNIIMGGSKSESNQPLLVLPRSSEERFDILIVFIVLIKHRMLTLSYTKSAIGLCKI